MLERAAKSLDRALELAWYPPLILHARANVATSLGNDEIAIELLKIAISTTEELLKLGPDVPVQDTVKEEALLSELGLLLQKMGRDDEAVALYQKGVLCFIAEFIR